MYRKLTGPVRAQLIRDSTQWGSHVKNLCEDIDVLVAEVEHLRSWQEGLVTENKMLLVRVENRDIVIKQLQAKVRVLVARNKRLVSRIKNRDAEIKSLRFEHYNCPEEQR